MSTINISWEGLTLLHEYIYIMSCKITEQLWEKKENMISIPAEGLAEDQSSNTHGK